MKRLGIFVFYDKDGIVDNYIDYLLEDLSKSLSDLIIVVNGILNDNGKKIFLRYTDRIVIRKNIGFDAGAYVDILLNYIGQENLKKWDELILCNDTFYGPFIPFSDIFARMEKFNIDFWGLVENKDALFTFIHSYFIVFGKKIIKNGLLANFMKNSNLISCADYLNVCAIFEHYLFQFLIKHKATYTAYSNIENNNIYYSAYESIANEHVPILKKKTFIPKYFNIKQQKKILLWIHENTNYPVKYILENAKRQYMFDITLNQLSFERDIIYKYNLGKFQKTLVSSVNEKTLLEFFCHNKNIFFYGTGLIARIIYYSYHSYIIDFCGFIVSDNQKIECNKVFNSSVFKYSDISTADGALVVALNKKNTDQVKDTLQKDKKFKDILFICK